MKPTSREQKKRYQIRETGQSLFLQNGFSKTSMDAISKESGVSKATIYKYYSSKEELLSDILMKTIDQIIEYQRSTLDEDYSFGSLEEFVEQLNRLAYQIVTLLMHEEYLALMRLIIAEIATIPELGDLFLSTIQKPAMQNNLLILKRAKNQGLLNITDEQLESAGRMFFGPLLTYVFVNGIMVEKGFAQIPSREKISEIIDLYVRAIT